MSFLWTDKCYLLVLLFSAFAVLLGTRKQPTRVALRRIIQRPLAVISGIILVFFLIISILDSIHIQFSAIPKGDTQTRVLSGTILDWALYPLGNVYEKTYSAPLALTLFTSETKIIADNVVQVYPAIKYPSFEPKTRAHRAQFITKSLTSAFFYSVYVLFFLYAVWSLFYYHRYKRYYLMPSLPSKVAWLTLGVLFFIVFSLYFLSRQLHVFGTGKIGQDILYYAIKSIRTGLVIGLLTTLIMLPLALVLGIAAGYFGGVVDDVIQYLYTTLSSIPGVLLITASVLSMQTFIANHPEYFPSLASSADARLFALCLILGVTSWTSLCRLLRAEVLKLREVDYVQAAVALGSRSFTIIVRHLLPNVMHIVVITLVLDFSFLVLAEAVLSYVGVGVSPMTISWGNMINGARLELAREPLVWWPMLAAFTFMFLLVLCGNLFADAVRDAFDPHQSHS
jgi:peptide/nickel transport system permease protein